MVGSDGGGRALAGFEKPRLGAGALERTKEARRFFPLDADQSNPLIFQGRFNRQEWVP
jgi:hypothetical protein